MRIRPPSTPSRHLRPLLTARGVAALAVCAAAFAAAGSLAPAGRASVVFTVNSIADPGIGVCDAAECTLREAITAANAAAGADTIAFDIAGAGPHTITPASALPTITGVVVVDGDRRAGLCGLPLVEMTAPTWASPARFCGSAPAQYDSRTRVNRAPVAAEPPSISSRPAATSSRTTYRHGRCRHGALSPNAVGVRIETSSGAGEHRSTTIWSPVTTTGSSSRCVVQRRQRHHGQRDRARRDRHGDALQSVVEQCGDRARKGWRLEPDWRHIGRGA